MSYKLIVASAHQTGLPDKSIHLICCSPPYFGLRSYQGDQAIEWPEVSYAPIAGMSEITIKGCEPNCAHEWVDGKVITKSGGGVEKSTLGTPSGGGSITREAHIRTLERSHFTATQGAYCQRCGGWRGGLGSEPDIESFIGHLVLVLREMHRVLRNDGTLWFNLGDSYATPKTGNTNGTGSSSLMSDGRSESSRQTSLSKTKTIGLGQVKPLPAGLKQKNMLLIPARFALAAQADGWIVRSAMPWIKRNGLPDSTEDRPGQAIESVFMLTKQEKYYFDMMAVRQNTDQAPDIRKRSSTFSKQGEVGRHSQGEEIISTVGRNLRAADLFFKTWEGMLLDDCGDPMAMVINPKGFSGSKEVKISRWVPVANDAVSDDTLCKVSIDCPVHGDLGRQDATVLDGVRVVSLLTRNPGIYDRHAQELLSDCVPTDPQRDGATEGENLDCSHQPDFYFATDHNNQTSKTGRALATTSPYKLSVEKSVRTDDIQELPLSIELDPGSGESNISASDYDGDRKTQIPDRTARTPELLELFLASWPPSCTCKLYHEVQENANHFACFPPELPEMAILAGTSAYGVCKTCGAPYRRSVVKVGERETHGPNQVADLARGKHGETSIFKTGKAPVIETTGWYPTCRCVDNTPTPAVVADFFSGSGTTGMVCQWLGRDYIGIDLSDEYHALAHERINTPREKVEDKRAPHPELQRGLFEGIAL